MVCLDFIYSYLASVIDCGQTFVGWFIPNNVTYLLMIWTSWQWNTYYVFKKLLNQKLSV